MTTLPSKWSDFLLTQAETGMDYQTVAITLVDGRIFDDVAVIHHSIIGEVRGYAAIPFDPAEIAGVALTHRKWQFRR